MDLSKSIIQTVSFCLDTGEEFSFHIKRDDCIDEHVSGNKWRKLKYAVAFAIEKNAVGIVTFGGAFSNHLVATAKACKDAGLKSIGIVRGEELTPESNATLKQCSMFGMELDFVPRSTYLSRNDYEFLSCVKDNYKGFHLVPEGGACFHGVVGCQEIVNELESTPDFIYVAAGTGTTAAGILLGCPEATTVKAISALKGDFMRDEILKHINSVLYNQQDTEELSKQLSVVTDFHFGGYGKWTDELIVFIQDFYCQTGVKLDPIYTGKAMFALINDFRNGRLNSSQNVVFVHTGGLQGVRGVEDKLGYQLFI
jgi:1-aminocyclopropane-1-carboxylate deaminase